MPDTIKASVKIIPDSVPGWWASTTSRSQTTYTQHFTGNYNSSAASEWNWAAGGGRAQIGSTGSYHIIVDGREVIIALPFDKAAGHAANNTGNLTSYASEMAIAGGYEAAFQNAAHVAAGVIVSKKWEADTALLQHWNWLRSNGDRKNCPSIIREKGDWPRFVATVARNVAAIRAHIAGTPNTPTPPTYAAPVIIPELDAVSRAEGIAPYRVDGGGTTWVWVGDRVRTTQKTGRFRYANLGSERVGPDIPAGADFDVDWLTHFEGAWWYYTPYATRIYADHTERVNDAKGE